MTADEPTDPLLRMLARLPATAPGVEWQERVRTRCHAALSRNQQRQTRTNPLVRILEVSFPAGLGLYLVKVFSEAVRLRSHF